MKYFNLGSVRKGKNNEEKLLCLLDMMKKDDFLVLNGDILELKQFKPYEIWNKYGILLGKIFGRENAIYNAGNHDLKLLGKQFYGVTVQPYAIIEGILFIHGHQFDWLNNKSYWMVDWALQALRWMEEHINPYIDIDLDRLLKYGKASDSDEKYIGYAVEEAKRCRVEYVALGHTHRRKIANRNGIYYCNSGCWVNGKSDYLEFTLDDERKIYCISDLHLGDKGKADDFWTI